MNKEELKNHKKELQDIQLRNGDKVTMDRKSRHPCNVCGIEIWYAATKDDLICIELVSLAEWDLHKCKTAQVDLIQEPKDEERITLPWARKFRELMILDAGNDRKLIEDFIAFCNMEEKEVYNRVRGKE